jgi:O-antigen/teichoic acid export membrane protein
MIKKNKLIKVILGFSMASWLSAALNFGILPISTRYYAPDQLAKVNLFLLVCTIIMPLVSLGLDQGYMRFAHEKKTLQLKNDLLSSCLFTGIYTLIIIALFAIPFRSPIAQWIFNEQNNFVIVLLFLCTLNLLVLRYISILHRMNDAVLLFTITSVASVPLLKISFLIAAFYNPEYKTVISIMAFTSFITLVITLILNKKIIDFKVSFKKPLTSNLFVFSIPLMPISVIALLNNNIPILLLRSLDNLTNLGIYSTAVTLVGIITLLQSGLNIFWSPYVYKNYKKDSALITIRKMQELILFAMVSFVILIIMFQDFIMLLLGKEYRMAVNFFPLLLISPVCYTVAETTGIGITLIKKSYINLYIYILCIVTNIIACYILIPLYSLSGAAIASAISSIFMLILKTLYGQIYYKSIGNYQLLMVGMFILVAISIVNIVFTDYKWICTIVNILSMVTLSFFFSLKYFLIYIKKLKASTL